MTTLKSYYKIIKDIVAIILTLLIVIAVLSSMLYKTHVNRERLIIAEEDNISDVISNNIYHELQNTQYNLMFLKSDFELKMSLEENALDLLKNEWQIFSKVMKDYHQIRYIDENGNEIIRINNEDNQVFIVPESQLQNKADSYYFKESLLLEEGEFYHSKFDLNVENGVVEIPKRPMIRVATPVFDTNGNRKGIIILNYSGQNILNEFHKYKDRSNGTLYLINHEGGWLISNNSAFDWSFINSESIKGFNQIHKNAWEKIINKESLIIDKAEAFIVHKLDITEASLNIGHKINEEAYQTWYIVSHIDQNNGELHFLHHDPLHLVKEVIKKNMILLVVITLLLILILRLMFTRDKARIKARYYSTIFEEMIMNSPDYIYLKDVNGKYVDMSATLIKLINRQKTDIIGYSNKDIFGDELEDFFNDQQLKSLTTNLFLSVSETKEQYINVMKLSLVDSKKHFMSTLVIGRDVTDQIIIENKLRESEGQAIKAKELQAKFLSNMSHEIRAPLNGIMSMLEMISMSTLSKDQTENLTIANHSAQSLLTIVNDILDFSKIEANELTLKCYAFNLKELAKELIKIFEQQASEAVELSMYIDEKLPEVLLGDGVRVRQVLTNLLSNAVKFTEVGKVTLSIHRMEHKDGYVDLQFSVHDTGKGICQEDQKKLFDRFSQFDHNHENAHKGTGLGLSISSMLVRLMGSELQFTSAIDIGSNFYFKIRLTLPEENEKINNIEILKPQEARSTSKKILILEDELVNRMMIQKYFERLDVETIVIDPKDEVIEVIKNQNLDCVFINIDLTNIDKLINEIKLSVQGTVPFVALTLNTIDNIDESKLQYGVDDFLSKPIDIMKFDQIIKNWINN